MANERIVLARQVREYFAAIGKRGGQVGRRNLTRAQARLMVAIREAKRTAKEKKRRGSQAHPQTTRSSTKAEVHSRKIGLS